MHRIEPWSCTSLGIAVGCEHPRPTTQGPCDRASLVLDGLSRRNLPFVPCSQTSSISALSCQGVLALLGRRFPALYPDQQLIVFGGEHFFAALPGPGTRQPADRWPCVPVRPFSRYPPAVAPRRPDGSAADSWRSRHSCCGETPRKDRGTPAISDCAGLGWRSLPAGCIG